MGRIEIHGDGAESFLESLCTRRLSTMQSGQSRYSHMCNAHAGILDDVIVSRFDDHWLVVCNASNRSKIYQWMLQNSPAKDTQIVDKTEMTLMLALQGPKAIEEINKLLPRPVDELKKYWFYQGELMMMPFTVFRSGYTGEDGVELIMPSTVADMLGGFLRQLAGEQTIKPAGLGARDTLRLEAAMPLYGHELHENIDSISAGCKWAVDLDKDFTGVETLRKINENGPEKKLVGLELHGRRIARENTALAYENKPVGEITSGTFSPTLEKSIAMGYVQPDLAEPGQTLTANLGRKDVDATVVKLPFYKR
jgi:aminomethyltransferase